LYQESLGLPGNAPVVTLGEGNTPLLSSRFNSRQVYLKMEGQNPTGSYKDRGSAVLTSFLRSRSVSSAVEDSSGNAGASLAAYCARAGISVAVFIPETASGPKRWQIEMYGAEVHRIPGARANAANAVLEAVKGGRIYASHAFMPFGLTGIATIAYEIFEQLGRVPGTLIAPVGHGGLLYGLMLGFEALLHNGASRALPYYIGVQAENCAPVLEAYRRHSIHLTGLVTKPTLAEGTSVSSPVRGGQILARMLPGGGEMQGCGEDQLLETYVSTARSGVFCEPTSCLSLIPLLNDKIELAEPVVAVLTGAGFKTNAIL
jgi:threonine synthase